MKIECKELLNQVFRHLYYKAFLTRLQSIVHDRKYPPLSSQTIYKFEVATCNGLRGRGQTRDVAQYPLQYMSYAPAKFEVAFSNDFGGNAFTRYI